MWMKYHLSTCDFFLKKLKSNTYLTYFEMEELLMKTDHQSILKNF
jgi:hypothetical protein